MGVTDTASDSVTTGSVVLYPELAADDAIVSETDDPVGKAEELPLRKPGEVEGSGTDVAVSGADVMQPPADTVGLADVPYKLVPEIEEDLEGASVKEELRDFVEEPPGSDADASVHGM